VKIIYPSDPGYDGETFYFKQQGYCDTPIILPSDIKNLEGISLKCVRKIVRATYREISLELEGKVLTVKCANNISK
jgi:hypothetical protein